MSTLAVTLEGIAPATLTIDLGTPGPQGLPGPTGSQGPTGATGAGVAAGGTTGMVLQKLSATNYDTGWATPAADYITAVTAPLAVTSGNLSVNLSTYLPLAGGAMDADATITLEDTVLDRVSEVGGYGFAVSSASNINLKTNVLFDRVLVAGAVGATTIKPTGVEFPDLTLQTSAGISAATVSATYQTLAGMSSYLTTATAATTYAPIAAGLPTGGTVGQVLTKQSGANFDASFATLIPGDRYLTTSTTSNTVSNGNKTFTVGTGLSYTPTQNLTIAYDASHHMHGEVLTYNSGTGVLTVDINNHTGTGTYSSWVVNVGGVTPLSSVAWGAITGTLGDQTDLATALNDKLEISAAASTYYPLSGNPSSFLTPGDLTPYLTISDAASTYTTFGYTASTYFLLAGGALNLNTNITASNTSDSDSEMAGFGFGVQKSSDHTKGTTVEFDGLDTYDGASHMQVNPTGLTFPDATTQTTSATNLGYISQGTADGLYYSISNPNGFTSNYFDATAAIQAVSNSYASSVGNYPSNGNYLKYNGMTLEWDTPGGGGGYITSVTAPLSVSAGDLSVYLGDYYLNSNPNGFTNYQDSNAISAISGGATSSISGSPSSGNVLGYNGSQITWVSNGAPYYNSVWAYGNWYSANVTGIYDGYMNYYTVLTF